MIDLSIFQREKTADLKNPDFPDSYAGSRAFSKLELLLKYQDKEGFGLDETKVITPKHISRRRKESAEKAGKREAQRTGTRATPP